MLEPTSESLPPEVAAQRHRGSIEPAPPNATALPDLLLIERARGKETRAFETLMRRYNQRLFRIARSLVPDADIAENVVQEAYLLAFSDIEHYEPTGKFGAWLARLTFNWPATRTSGVLLVGLALCLLLLTVPSAAHKFG